MGHSSCLFLISFRVLFFWDAKLYHPIHNFHGISGDIHYGWHGYDFACPHIELGPVTRAYNTITFKIALAHRAIVVGTHIRYGEELTGNIEDHNRFAFDLDK